MKKILRNSKGYSLLELIAALVLMGFLIAIAGSGLADMVAGYNIVKRASEASQKAQFAMSRMIKEFTITESVGAVASGDITYDILTIAGRETHRLYQQGGNLYFENITVDPGHGHVLTDDVTNFTVTYDSGTREIGLTLSMSDSPRVFVTSVYHRNAPSP